MADINKNIQWGSGVSAPPATLNPPTDAEATANGLSAITVTWTAPTEKASAQGYRVYYATDDRLFAAYESWGADNTVVINDDGNNPFEPLTEYRFVVVTTDGSSLESVDSNLAIVTTGPAQVAGAGYLVDDPQMTGGLRFDDPRTKSTSQGAGFLVDDPQTNAGLRFVDPTGALPPATPVDAPTILSVIPLNDSALRVTWQDNQVNSADSFRIFVVNQDTGLPVAGYNPKQVGGTLSSYDISLLEAETTYTVTMTATAGSDESDPSNTVPGTTAPPNELPTTYAIQNPVNGPVILKVVHPRPAGEVSAHAVQASCTQNMDYSIPVNVQGGGWPYHFELTTAPAGMTIGEFLQVDGDGVLVDDGSYGTVTWPSGSITPGTHNVTVKVTDQFGSVINISWTVTLDESRFVWLDNSLGAGSGSFSSPYNDIDDVIRSTSLGGKICVIRAGSGDYASAGPVKATLYTGNNPVCYIGYPSERPVLDCSTFYFGANVANNDTAFVGLELKNTPILDTTVYIIFATGHRHLIHDNIFHDITASNNNNNDSLYHSFATGASGDNNRYQYLSFTRNSCYNIFRSGDALNTNLVNTYNQDYACITDNVFSNISIRMCVFAKLARKGFTFRNNKLLSGISSWSAMRYSSFSSPGPAEFVTEPHTENEFCFNSVNQGPSSDSIFFTAFNNYPNVAADDPEVTKEGMWVYRNTVNGRLHSGGPGSDTIVDGHALGAQVTNANVYSATGYTRSTDGREWSDPLQPDLLGITTGMDYNTGKWTDRNDARLGIYGSEMKLFENSTPPPPQGRLFTDSFDGSMAGEQNGINWRAVDAEVVVSTDVSHSGSSSLKFNYAGNREPTSPEARLGFSAAYKDLWYQYYVYYPAGFVHDNWNGASSNNKFFVSHTLGQHAPYSDLDYLSYNIESFAVGSELDQPSCRYRGRYLNMPGTINVPVHDYGTTNNGQSLAIGSWHKVKIHTKCATYSGDKINNDGQFQMWIDDVEVYNYPAMGDQPWTPYGVLPAAAIPYSAAEGDDPPKLANGDSSRNQIDYTYFYGASNSRFENATAVYLDDLTIAASEADL